MSLLAGAVGGGYTWAFGGPWVAMIAFAIWIACTAARLLRRDAVLRTEIQALQALSRALSPTSAELSAEPCKASVGSRPHHLSTAEQELALRGAAALGSRAARTAVEWLMPARERAVAHERAPSLACFGLRLALDREICALVQTAREPSRQLIPLALATTAAGLLSAVLVLVRAATATPAPSFTSLAEIAPLFAGAMATLATGFFLGCLAVLANILANVRFDRAHRELADLAAEIELHAQHRARWGRRPRTRSSRSS
jgi:hypothetical protein